MGSTGQINSESYWDTRFKEDWESCSGPWQTRFFYQIAVDHLPHWLMWQIKSHGLTLVDWGCAQGDGVDVWATYLGPGQVAGVDFSAVAVAQAAERYPSVRFIHEDWLGETQDIVETFDIVFSSNTLEHFHSPFAVLKTLLPRARKAVILALPYKEMDRIDEHFYTFLPENIPLRLPNGFRLFWAKVVDCRNLPRTQWGGDQVILMYAAEDWIDDLGLTLSDCQIEHADHYSEAMQLADARERDAMRAADARERNIKELTDACGRDLEHINDAFEACVRYIAESNEVVTERGGVTVHLNRATWSDSPLNGIGPAIEAYRDKVMALLQAIAGDSGPARDAEMQRVIKRKDGELAEASAALTVLREQLAQSEARLTQSDQQLDYANRQFALMQQSRAWRVASLLSRIARALTFGSLGSTAFDQGNGGTAPGAEQASIWRRRMHYIINRYSEGVRRHGLIGSVRPAARAVKSLSSMWLKKRLRNKLYERRLTELGNLISSHQGFVDIFHVPMGWKTPLFQRFQHMSLQASQLGGLALYGGHLQVDVDLFVYERSQDGVVVFDALDQRVVDTVFSSLRHVRGKKILRLQSIDLVTRIDEIKRLLDDGFTVVYEYIDEISEEITGEIPSFVLERHKWLLSEPRILVVGTSDKIYEQVRQQRQSNYLLSTNGVDLSHWYGTPRNGVPAALEPAMRDGRVIVGYHGALANWIDYELLRKIARDGRFELVLIGYAHDSSLEESGLLECEHVHFLGSKSYFELNEYAACYGIGILPFKKYELTESVSPVKLFEYMAAGKPVVTTDLRECTKYRSCLVASNHEQFMANLDAAIALRTDEAYLRLLRGDAEENSWRGKTLAIFNELGVETTK
ncbi:methyltransferase domain-containing protein [Burkholderia gladioli]|uniref:methyltransferase domain-containing protein n=1 Tax=Burkholderia gladioli TaxID=28095 RepID=UPI0016412B49|nr:methyltransferase domain-containing protein [Burkholderia gladioli]